MKSQFIARKLLKNSQDDAKEAHFPSLRQLAVETIALNFELYPSMESVSSPTLLEEIYSKISIPDINIALLAKAIDSEEFWKRACSEKFAILDSNFLQGHQHASPVPSPKQTFFEIYFKRILNDPTVDADFLMQMARVAGGLIRKWSIEEVTPKLERTAFEALIYMEKLEHLSVNFACPMQETDFGIDAYRGFNLERANSFEGNARLTALRSLKLENNLITDKVAEVLLKGLKGSTQLESLSLARNKLGDLGVEIVCSWVKNNPKVPLRHLNLSDNDIGYEGGRIVAEYFRDPNFALTSINLKINFLNNSVFEILLKNLSSNKNSTLRSLNLGSNLIRDNQFDVLRAFVGGQNGLEELLLDGNEISLEDDQVAALQALLGKNQSLKRFSLKFNKLKPDVAAKLQK